jgi:hypothetical protein
MKPASVPVSRPNPNQKAKFHWNMYRERNRIERRIGHLKINRAIAREIRQARPLLPRALIIAAIRRRYAIL